MKKELTPEQKRERKYKFGALLILVAAVVCMLEWYVDSPDSTGQVGQPDAQVYEDQLESQVKTYESVIAAQKAELNANKATIAKDEQELKANAK